MLCEELKKEAKAAKAREVSRKQRAKMSPEDRKEYDQARYKRQKVAFNRRSKEWAQENPHKSQASVHQTTIKKRYPNAWGDTDIVTSELSEWLKENRDNPCQYCSDPSTHIDHIKPLSRGGQHRWINIELICSTCNMAKGTKSKDEYKRWIERVVVKTTMHTTIH
jgi:5-methylcytosine-specific restriction endonuclease McrA